MSAEHACCRKFRAAKKYIDVGLKVLMTMAGQTRPDGKRGITPRLAVQWYEITERSHPGIHILAAGDACPCQGAPHPEAFRALCDWMEARAKPITTDDIEAKARALLEEAKRDHTQ